MPDEIVPEAVPVEPVVAPTVVPPVVADDQNPKWLAPKLDATRKALLNELGVTDVAAAKAAIKAASDAAEASKSAETKAAELSARLTGMQAEANRVEAIIKGQAEGMLSALAPAHKQAVLDIAGDDPAEQLKAIRVLGPTWAKGVADEKAADPDTSSAKKAPAGGTVSPDSPKATYQEMVKSNPFFAAAYGQEHAAKVYASE